MRILELILKLIVGGRLITPSIQGLLQSSHVDERTIQSYRCARFVIFSSHIGQVPSDVGRLPRTHIYMLVVNDVRRMDLEDVGEPGWGSLRVSVQD